MRVTTGNSLPEIAEAIGTIRESLHARGLPAALVDRVALVLEEILTNVVRHGFGDAGRHEITIETEVHPAAVALTVADDGRPFDPSTHPLPPDEHSLLCAARGGRGLKIVRRLVRRIAYRRENGRNVTCLEVTAGDETTGPPGPENQPLG